MAQTAAEKEATRLLTTAGLSVEEVLKNSDKAFGVSLADLVAVPDVFSTGNIIIDALIGVGGMPRGRIAEFFGPPSSGKTTTALQTAVSAQEKGEKIVYLDFENDLDEDYCEALGLDTGEGAGFIHVEPPSLEKGANLMRALLNTGDIGLFVVDSVAAMTTEAEAALATGDRSGVAERARLMAQLMRQIRNPVKKTNSAVIFINHLQEKIDMSPMGQQMARKGIKQYTTPGGEALKFYSSLRIQYKQTTSKKADERSEITNADERVTVAHRVKVKVVKNKVAPPFREAEVTVRYGRGFSQAQSALDVLVAHSAVRKKSGGWYEWPAVLAPSVDEDGHMMVKGKITDDGGFTIQSEEAAIEALDTDREWLARNTETARALMKEHGAGRHAPEEE